MFDVQICGSSRHLAVAVHENRSWAKGILFVNSWILGIRLLYASHHPAALCGCVHAPKTEKLFVDRRSKRVNEAHRLQNKRLPTIVSAAHHGFRPHAPHPPGVSSSLTRRFDSKRCRSPVHMAFDSQPELSKIFSSLTEDAAYQSLEEEAGGITKATD